jgi:predicted N-acetyltransferase YhbS
VSGFSSLHIRPARSSDALFLTALARRAKAKWGYPAEWLAQWQTDLTLSPEYLASNASFVAIDGADLLGVCVLEISAGRSSLAHLWIEPDRQRHGIGRVLVSHALQAARQAGRSRVEVIADPFAERFYVKLGAVRVGTVAAPMPGDPARALPVLEFTL